jgi:hypothetical protein
MIAALLLVVSHVVGPFYQPLSQAEQIVMTPYLIIPVLLFALASVYLAVWWVARDYRIFGLMGIYLALVGSDLLFEYFGLGGTDPVWKAIATPFLIIIAAEAMRVPNRRWTWFMLPFCILLMIAGLVPAFAYLRGSPIAVTQIALAVLIVQGFRNGNRRDRQIAVAFTFLFLMRWASVPSFRALTHTSRDVQIAGWRWPINTCSMVILGAATLAIFVRDLVHDRTEKQRLANELAAGRAVQQMLIPHATPAIAGFNIASVYLPYSEVGGDFFQVLSRPDGSVLVAIGDVSGKGMPAALLVSLLIGTLTALAETSGSPAILLSNLNRLILGRSQGGFTTCLILCAHPDGRIVVASAGHLAPYRQGRELCLDSDLPLGISKDAAYMESTFHLDAGESLTLLTDGVLEARHPDGELFGFDRTSAISVESAEMIAQTAQAFGQQDDITVLSIAFAPAETLQGQAAVVG